MAAAASATIFDLAYSIRIAPRSDDSRNVPCSADIAEPAHAASLNSMNATGTLPCCVPFECIRRRLKPGKLRLCVCVCDIFGWYACLCFYGGLFLGFSNFVGPNISFEVHYDIIVGIVFFGLNINDVCFHWDLILWWYD